MDWVANIQRIELEQGFTLVGEASWLRREEWNQIVVTQDRQRIRLVLLDAKEPGKGAFTRLVDGIFAAGLNPVIVEPVGSVLIDWCHRHDFRKRIVGREGFRHEIWYPRGRR